MRINARDKSLNVEICAVSRLRYLTTMALKRFYARGLLLQLENSCEVIIENTAINRIQMELATRSGTLHVSATENVTDLSVLPAL